MKYFVLGSGSKGNSVLISSKDNFIIIDLGLGIREFENKINRLGFYKQKALAVFITHEHKDHTKALKYFNQNIVYAGAGTCLLQSKNILNPFETIQIKNFKITPLPLSHDAINCFGYVVESNNKKLALVTDTGYINEKLKPYIKNSNYYIFESNHDIEMLIKSRRPSFLKNRILSDNGHLSNVMASEELCEIIGEKTSEIVFAHVSQEVNTKELVLKTFCDIANENNKDISKINLLVADQKEVICGGSNEENTFNN